MKWFLSSSKSGDGAKSVSPCSTIAPTEKSIRVREAHNELLDAMMQSYRNPDRFARRNNLSVSASPQDIGVLTRKLYAAFEALPGKVTLVNPQISPDHCQAKLTFIYVPPGAQAAPGYLL